MAEIWMVVSGKGGVGKSTVCTMLGAALAIKGKRVLLLETDWGQRGLDIMNGVHQQVVYDLRDLLERRCQAAKGIVTSRLNSRLFLLPACTDRNYQLNREQFLYQLENLRWYYDYILIDCPAGLGSNVEVCMEIADKALVVVTPDLLTVRVAASAADLLRQHHLPARLLINKVPAHLKKTQAIPDLDAVIDMVGLQLLGVIPMDHEVTELLCTMEEAGWQHMSRIKCAGAFSRIADRLQGKYLPLLVK